MKTDMKMYMNQKARDMMLVHIFSETLAVKFLLTSLYSKVYGMSQEDAIKTAKQASVDALDNVFVILSRYVDLDVPGLRKDLGL